MSDESAGPLKALRFLLFVLLGVCLVIGSIIVCTKSSSVLKESKLAVLKQFPPKDVAQLVEQRDVLLEYASQFPGRVLFGFCTLYVSMQTFAIPGTLTLSVLAGAIYGSLRGLVLVTFISTVGSTCCYGFSHAFGRGMAQAMWPSKVEAFGKEVAKRRGEMFNYIIFLRLTPILPNTFINVASPVVRVPILPFIAGTFLGCIPNNFVAVSTGNKLSSLSSLSELYDIRQLLLGLLLGVVALLPIYLKRRNASSLGKLFATAREELS